MEGSHLFEWLVKYHIDSNLKEGLENEVVKDGIMHFQGKNGKEVLAVVGDENGQPWYKGLLLLTNGSDIADILKEANVILVDPKRPISFVDVKDDTIFYDFLRDLTRKDNAVIHDSIAGRITKARLNNNSPSLENIVSEDILPFDYLSEDRSFPLYNEYNWTNLGNRSDVAVKASRGVLDSEKKYHPVDAYLIKHTIYNNLGFGPVVKISKNEMLLFFFKYLPEYSGPFIDDEHKIGGVLKTYNLNKDRRFTKVYEDIVDINKEGRLAYSSGKLVFPDKVQSIINP